MMLHKDCQTKCWQIKRTDRNTGRQETKRKNKIENIATFLQLARRMKLKLGSVRRRRRDRSEHSKYKNRRRPAAHTHFHFYSYFVFLCCHWNGLSTFALSINMNQRWTTYVRCHVSVHLQFSYFHSFHSSSTRTFAHWLSMLWLCAVRQSERATPRAPETQCIAYYSER